ncbi:hypothetical protein K1T71_003609 [Dendrolimus kikuchii]|uniref:Uncharacterized protein n=1 Tax=Dendrolimus kikuchii TaxID=765133 RepID=A0ACC1D8M8_9NEOP|nr:hypothetical protein K1T71_003609 [Dendrolimus kikuchii]
MLRWFGHVERMTKQIYNAKVDGCRSRGRPRHTFHDQIDRVLAEGDARSLKNRRACMRRVMNVKEASEVCKNKPKWHSVYTHHACPRRLGRFDTSVISILSKSTIETIAAGNFDEIVIAELEGDVRSLKNRRACMTRVMNVKEASEVCKNKPKWHSVVRAYPARELAFITIWIIMDSLQDTMSQLVTSFKQRMDNFEGELQKGHSSTTLSSLAAEFSTFKVFTLNTLKVLQSQIELLQQSTDNMEMYSRRKILLIHGVKEDKQEDLVDIVSKLVISKLKLDDFSREHIRRCHRMGKPPSTSKKPRPILLKLSDISLRNLVWSAKSKLKGSGVTVSEFLTKMRHNTFMEARKRFGISKCWTQNGTIFVTAADDNRFRIKQLSDLDNIALPREDPQSNKDAPAATKTRRAATTSKK